MNLASLYLCCMITFPCFSLHLSEIACLTCGPAEEEKTGAVYFTQPTVRTGRWWILQPKTHHLTASAGKAHLTSNDVSWLFRYLNDKQMIRLTWRPLKLCLVTPDCPQTPLAQRSRLTSATPREWNGPFTWALGNPAAVQRARRLNITGPRHPNYSSAFRASRRRSATCRSRKTSSEKSSPVRRYDMNKSGRD